MSGILPWICGFSIGAMAALLYLGGLWFTVRRLARAAHPLGMYSTSLLLRVSLLAGVFAFLLQYGWREVVAAGVAFVLVRFVLVFMLMPARAEVTAS